MSHSLSAHTRQESARIIHDRIDEADAVLGFEQPMEERGCLGQVRLKPDASGNVGNGHRQANVGSWRRGGRLDQRETRLARQMVRMPTRWP